MAVVVSLTARRKLPFGLAPQEANAVFFHLTNSIDGTFVVCCWFCSLVCVCDRIVLCFLVCRAVFRANRRLLSDTGLKVVLLDCPVISIVVSESEHSSTNLSLLFALPLVLLVFFAP